MVGRYVRLVVSWTGEPPNPEFVLGMIRGETRVDPEPSAPTTACLGVSCVYIELDHSLCKHSACRYFSDTCRKGRGKERAGKDTGGGWPIRSFFFLDSHFVGQALVVALGWLIRQRLIKYYYVPCFFYIGFLSPN